MKKSKSCALIVLSTLYAGTSYADENTTLTALTSAMPAVELSGSVMLDYDQFDASFLEKTTESDDDLYIRRLSLGLESYFYKDWFANVDVDIADGFELKDAYVNYSGWTLADITLGKQKEPFGLEKLMSSKNTLMIERSMGTSAQSLSRAYGVKLAGRQFSSVNWQLGYFQNNLQSHILNDDTVKTSAITGKLTWAPWQEGNDVLHLGTSFSQRDLNGGTFKINQKMDVYGADSLIEGDAFNADKSSLNGIEFIWQYQGLLTMAEWQQTAVTADNNSEYDYQGGYYQMSYVFSGKNRKYKQGTLGSLKTKNDWEIAMRYSQLALDIENSQAKSVSLGLNYYYDKNLKLMANYIKGEYVDEGVNLGSGNAFSLRVQYRF